MALAGELAVRLGYLKGRRNNHEQTWQDINDLMQPFRGDITTKKSPGGKRIGSVFDTTAMQAADTFVNFLKSAVLPSSTDWLRLKARKASGDIEIRALLDRAAMKILEALGDSNFYIQATQALRDFAILGNATLYCEENTPRLNEDGSTFAGLLFESVPVGSMWWLLGKDGTPIMAVREMDLPAADAYNYFGGNAGTAASEAMSGGNPMELIRYYHFVFPTGPASPVRSSVDTDKKWASVYYCEATGRVISEGGYDFLPYTISRFMVVDGEEYGRGKGHLARPDAAGINELRRQVLIAAGRDLNPPLMVEHDTMVELDIAPNGIVVTRPPQKMAPQFLKSGTDYGVADQIARQDRDQILKIFLGDVLQEPDSQPRSAEESRQRQVRAIQRLAAPAEAVNHEFLQPVISTVIHIMARGGALPELTEVGDMLGGTTIDVEFASPFFTAAKASSALRVQAFLERSLAMYQATQDDAYMEYLDPDKIAAYNAEMSDVPAEIFRSDEEVNARRQAKADRAAQQRMVELMTAAQGASQASPPSPLPASAGNLPGTSMPPEVGGQ